MSTITATQSIAVLAQRNAIKTRRVPTLIVFSLAMPLMMLILFSQVFQAIEFTPSFPVGVDYIDFLVPAALAAAVVMNASTPGSRIVHARGEISPQERPPMMVFSDPEAYAGPPATAL